MATFRMGRLEAEVRGARDAIWLLIRREGQGGLALRTACPVGDYDMDVLPPLDGEKLRLKVTSALGEHCLVITAGNDALDHVRVTVRLTPAAPLRVTASPRDLYPIDTDDDPLGAAGRIAVVQRDLNTGLVYFTLERPAFGTMLYVQNLTALNTYFERTKTTPRNVVGGQWPELGYLPPVAQGKDATDAELLQPGVPVTLSDAILVVRPDVAQDERESARHFLQMIGTAYCALDLPEVEVRDWIDRAERTVRDLDRSPKATVDHYGHRYVHPYVDAEYPDVMVQASIVAALHDWEKWLDRPVALKDELKTGLGKFYDSDLKTLRRYLPNVGNDKNADAVDSWYLYHPMLNIGRLAIDGDPDARRLFLKSLDFGIRSARHFEYKWPIQYDVTDFSVITETADSDGRGQTDVGGLYAWVMLQAFALTDQKEYLDEARCAIDAAIGLGFDINYQANLTAWGAAACMRLWRITGRQVYLEQSYVYLASFLHHCAMWESDIALARHYKTFLGATCLQDAPYMAIYECFDSFTAFEQYLEDSGPDLDPAVRMLVSEYCKYALDRAWFYYPDALPPEAISPKQRDANGHVDRALSFPLEDLYPDGKPAGQVGQEVYGAGAAFVFATRAFHHVEGAPFRLFCNHFLRAPERTGDGAFQFVLDGGEACTATLSLVRMKRRTLPKARLTTAGGDVLRPFARSDDRIDYRVPANGRLILSWD